MNLGSVWNREYRFARLDDFTSYSLANDTRRVGVPVRTARTFWYEPGALSFPLRKRYDETNRTLEGLSTWKVTRTWAPLPPPEGHERDGVIQPDAIHPGYIPDADDGAAESSGGESSSSGLHVAGGARWRCR